MIDLRSFTLPGMGAILCIGLVAACTMFSSSDVSSPVESLLGRSKLRIAVTKGLPGLSETVDGELRGFEIDVATQVARRLGASKVQWHDVQRPADRERLVREGRVDLVFASYIMNETRLDRVAFAGPYLNVGQDILVRRSDRKAITGLDGLRFKKTCVPESSTSALRLVAHFGAHWDTPEHLLRLSVAAQCFTALLDGRVDAVSMGNSVLVGFAARNPSRLHLIGKPFTAEEVGIGLAKSHQRDVAVINLAIQQMIRDGSWADSIRRNFGPSADSFLGTPPVPRS